MFGTGAEYADSARAKHHKPEHENCRGGEGLEGIKGMLMRVCLARFSIG